jgi:hypothetical protein
MAYEEWPLAGAPIRDAFYAGWSAAREYSKQREEKLLRRIRVRIDQTIVDPRLRTAGELEEISQLVIAALAENGGTDPGRLGHRRPGA